MNKPVKPPPPRVLVEAEPFIPYMKEEDFDPRLQPGASIHTRSAWAFCRTRSSFTPTVRRSPRRCGGSTATSCAIRPRRSTSFSSASSPWSCCAINGCAYCTAHSCSMLKKPARQ